MPTSSSFLNLSLYDVTSDASSLFLSFIDDLDGVRKSSASKIDIFAKELSASTITLQGEPSEISGSSIMSDTTGSIVKHNDSSIYVPNSASSVYNTMNVDCFGHVYSASLILLDSYQINLITRQGGSSTNWNTSGSIDYSTGSNIKMEVGVATITWPGGQTDATGTETFATAFSYNPIVFAQIQDASDYHVMSIEVSTISASGFIIKANTPSKTHDAPLLNTKTSVSWSAIGPI